MPTPPASVFSMISPRVVSADTTSAHLLGSGSTIIFVFAYGGTVVEVPVGRVLLIASFARPTRCSYASVVSCNSPMI